jgi:uncharacterized damage-inducible protein DinB
VTGISGELVGLSEYVYGSRIRPRLDGLTDEEYFWEPVSSCWSLRPDAEGVLRVDTIWPLAADHRPFTTLAWRLWHLICCYGATRNAVWLGVDRSQGAFDTFDPAPASAAAALDRLDDAYGWWSSTLRSLSDDELGEPLGSVAGQYADDSKAGFVLHMLDEVIHHGAETALMRDLYRAQVTPTHGAPATVLEAASGGYWADVRSLVDRGCAVIEQDESGRTALHFAAAAAPGDVVRLLIARGADVSARDVVFGATPRGWAEYFDRTDIAELLADQE